MSIFTGEIVQTGRAATTPRASASGLAEEIAAGFEAARRLDNSNGLEVLTREETRKRLAAIEQATGTRLPDPYRDQFDEVDERALRARFVRAGMRSGEAADVIIAQRRAALEARIDALAAARPAAGVETRDGFEARLKARARELELQAEGTGIGGFVGAVGAGFTDPVNLATAPAGFGSKTVLGAALKEAGVNIGIEAALQPVIQSNRAELGVSHGAGQAAFNIAAAGVFGGVFGGGIKLGEKAFGAMTRREAIDAVDALPDAAKTPEVSAARDALEKVLAADEAAGLDARPDPEIAADHRAALRAAEAAVDEGRVPAVEAPLVAETAPARALPPGYGEFDPDQVIVDAKRFQFKSGGDAAGVTGALKNIEKFDPIKAGELLFWQDLAGGVYVADGHQRTGLARELKARGDANARLRGPVLREADGFTAEDARAIAAAKNIAQGTGTAIDAAKVLKVRPDLLDGTLSRRTALMRDAEGLIRLGDDAFGMIINEVVPAQYGAIVGRLVDDAVEQLSVMGVVARQSPANAVEAEALVREALAAGFRKETQSGLFGDEIDAENLLGVRAAVLGSAVSQLRRDKRIFATLSDEAETIEAAGNRLAKEENEELARNATEISDIVLRTAHVSGPVADALKRAANHVAGGGQKAAAVRRFIGELRELGPAALRGLDQSRRGPGARGGAGETAGAGGPVSPASSRVTDETLSDFDDAETGAQFQRDELTADLFGEGDAAAPEGRAFLTGEALDDKGLVGAATQTRKQLEEEFKADDDMIARLEGCVRT